MLVKNLETELTGGVEFLSRELARVWDKHNGKVLEAVKSGQKYEDHILFSDGQGLHSKGVYVKPLSDGKISLEVHWAFEPRWPLGNSYGGCDLDLEIVA